MKIDPIFTKTATLLKQLIKYSLVFILLVGTLGGCANCLSEVLGIPSAKPIISQTFLAYWAFTNILGSISFVSFKHFTTDVLVFFLAGSALCTYHTLSTIIAHFNAGAIFLSKSNLFVSLLFIQIYAVYLSMEIINLCIAFHTIQALREKFNQFKTYLSNIKAK